MTTEQWRRLACRLEGKYVVLDPLELRHTRSLLTIGQRQEMWQYLDYDPTQTTALFRAWVVDAIADMASGQHAAFIISDAESGSPLGSTRYLWAYPQHGRMEIGWTWLVPEVWGGREEFETYLLLLGHAFEGIGVSKVEWRVYGDDSRLQRLLEQLPAQLEGRLRLRAKIEGKRTDVLCYGILSEEWLGVKRCLETTLSADSDLATHSGVSLKPGVK